MNLISNNCSAAFYYKFSSTAFNHPFMWCLFTPQDIIYLIKNYESIDFGNIGLPRLDGKLFPSSNLVTRLVKEGRNIIGVNIDDKVTAWYVHYLFDAHTDSPKTVGVDVFCKRNFEYTYEKYISRLHRNGISEHPTFLIVAFPHHNWTDEYITELCSINTDKKILLMTNKNISSKDNIYIIKDSLINLDTESLIKSHYAEIKGLLEG